MPLHVVMLALWALQDTLAQNPLTDEQRDALIQAVASAITSGK